MKPQYRPQVVEAKIYSFWEKGNFFNPDKLSKYRKIGAKNYCICIPPPNITGQLHMGHALNITIQDILIRQKRMQGFKTLWLPGTDHAGIATQNVVEKELKKEGLTRHNLGKSQFLKRVWEWKERYGNIILDQLKKLGCSLDWSRTRFTLDKEYIKAVQAAFKHYYKKGWIYRGKRVVNWCPRCQTSLSDLEIEYKEEKGKLWYLRYPLKDQGSKTKKEYITVATTRPETMLGDTAVAVNPKDKRYRNLIQKKAILPLVNREVSIIADKSVDPKFGTGAVKVTPAHDLTDYEISLRHNLPLIQIINEKAEITKEASSSYQGLTLIEARQKIIKDLEKKSLLEKTEDYIYQLPKCYRCSTTVQLIPSWQWFLKMTSLSKIAIKAVKNGKIRFYPKNWEKVYFNWLENIKDWCISRQIWWGHKIPLKGVDDTLDTWFSSALWPFVTLGWPKKTKDLKTFYPTNVLSTDRGIINLWVARMIFSGIEFMKKIPFKDIYIHPTVLTKEGKRMSKSLGTGINPMDLIDKYGTDATRFGMIYQTMGNQDIRFTEDHIVAGQKFCNKIWNASRFVLERTSDSKDKLQSTKLRFKAQSLTSADKKVLKALDKTIKLINKDLESFRFGQASHIIYNFFWHDFCDKYIEVAKKQLRTDSKEQTTKVLFYVLLTSLKLMHPFIPFITEEIYQKLPSKPKKAIIIEDWPIL